MGLAAKFAQARRARTGPAEDPVYRRRKDLPKLSLGRRGGNLLLGLGGRLLHAVVGAGGKLVLELLDPAGGVDVLELAGEERVAGRANIHAQLSFGAAGGELISAAARDFRH